MDWIERNKEEYIRLVKESSLPEDIKRKALDFYEEYEQKKDTHSAKGLEEFDRLNDEQLGELLYLDLEDFTDSYSIKFIDFIEKFLKCQKLKALRFILYHYYDRWYKEIEEVEKSINFRFAELFFLDADGELDGSDGDVLLSNLSNLMVLKNDNDRAIFNKDIINALSDKLVLILEITVEENIDLELYVNLNNPQEPLELPEELGDLKYILKLDFSQFNIKSLPSSIGNLTHLIELDLGLNPSWSVFNDIEYLPNEICNLKNLKRLYLENGYLEELPVDFGKLENLEELDLSNNRLEYLPESFGKLKRLKTLNLSNNNLKSLPASFANLQLQDLYISGNPFDEMPELKNLGGLGAIYYLKQVYGQIQYINLQIPKELVTPISQYLLFFKEYVKTMKNKQINFEIKEQNNDLMLVTNGGNEASIVEIKDYLSEYLNLARQNLEDWIPVFEKEINVRDADIFRLKVENQTTHLKNSLRIALVENKELRLLNRRFEDENVYLRELAMVLAQKENTESKQIEERPFDREQLVQDLIQIAHILQKRKKAREIEDLTNDKFTDGLELQGYQVADQARVGNGRTDISIKYKNTTVSIIEAFKLQSLGAENVIVSSHIDKLLHEYDRTGNQRNFVLVYAEVINFIGLWENYIQYINDLDKKPSFRNSYPLISFRDKSAVYSSHFTDIKVGLAKHLREGNEVEIIHIVIKM